MFLDRHRDRRQDSARYREQVGSEKNVVVLSAQLRGDGTHLGEMPMLVTHGIRAEILCDFRKKQIRPHRIARARHSAGGGDVYGSARHYPAFAEERGNGYQYRSWVAAG